MQHTRRKGIARPDAIRDVGDVNLHGLVLIPTRIDARRQAVMRLAHRMARRGGPDLDLGDSGKGGVNGFAALTFAGETLTIGALTLPVTR